MFKIGAGRALTFVGASAQQVAKGFILPSSPALIVGLEAGSGVTADPNGGIKWRGFSASPAVTPQFTAPSAVAGPDIAPGAFAGRPGIAFSAGKTLVSSPALDLSPASATYLTLAFVIKPTSLASVMTVIGASANGGFEILIGTDGAISLLKQNQAAILSSGPGAIVAGVTQLVIINYRSGTNNSTLWVNGVQVTLTTNATVAMTTGTTMTIGREGTSTARDFVGQIGGIYCMLVMSTAERATWQQCLTARWFN